MTATLDIMAVDLEPGAAPGSPDHLFRAPPPLLPVGYCPTPDGGFVFITSPEGSRPAPFTVVQNWATTLDR